MEDLDANLLAAWNEVSEKLTDRPWSLARRIERSGWKELRRPVRAWCLALRASDTRLGGEEMPDEHAAESCRRGYTHTLMLHRHRICELCAPVRIDWPGLTVHDAAARLGRDLRTVYKWSDQGGIECRKQPNPGKRGKPTRWVWTTRVLDPQADDGRGPWEAWGTLWQSLLRRVPEGFVQRLRRQPRLRDSAKDERTAGDAWPGVYRGWDWRCPGRVLADGTRVRCGRTCKKLWLPLPVWTLGDALGGRAGQAWRRMPRLDDRPCRFACSRCWGVRFDSPASSHDEAWNRFVSVVTGGLLYGREVQRPAGLFDEKTGRASILGSWPTSPTPS